MLGVLSARPNVVQVSLSETMSYKHPLKCWKTPKPISHNAGLKHPNVMERKQKEVMG